MTTKSENTAGVFDTSTDDERLLPALARRAVETFVRERRIIEPDSSSFTTLLRQPSACFVSIKTLAGELRGCIGTIEPATPTLATELIGNAVSAATRDPRFPPVAADELSRLRYSVDVLSEPEPAQFEELDPSVYGVVVVDETNTKRGLLLPALEGIDTAQLQIDIALRKAGIPPGSPIKIYRFQVRRFCEPETAGFLPDP